MLIHFRYTFCGLLTLALLWSSCTKELPPITNENDPLTIENVPEIDSLTMNATTVQEYSDSLVFSFDFLDGDGNLGSSNPDSATIELVDNRDPSALIFYYHLSPRAPDGTSIAVQGRLDVVLKNLILIDSDSLVTSETTTFGIRIKDEAQNWSNRLTSPQITINR